MRAGCSPRNLAADLAADLAAWLRLLALHDQDDLADAEPDTMRFHHRPGRLAHHARRRHLHLASSTWPWTPDSPAWSRITALPAVT
jgi:hypothetical protein